MGQPYPSLNLAQAVLVYAYELSMLLAIEKKQFLQVESSILTSLNHKLTRLYNLIDITPESTLHRRLTDCVNSANDEEIQTLFSLARKIEAHIDSSADEKTRKIKPSMTISR
jgi:tRNA/rRNA methyltransferase